MCQFKYYSISLFIVTCLFILKDTKATDCAWKKPFFDMVEQADVIVRGKILAHFEEGLPPIFSMEMAVLETYKGRLTDLNIRILTNDFYPPLRDFPVGTEWIFAVKHTEGMPENQYLMPDSCGNSYLKVEASVVGNINNTNIFDMHGTQQRVSLDEFRKIFQQKESKQLFTYHDGVQKGRQQCIEDPYSCGILISNCLQEISYDITTGKLDIPCVQVPDGLGGIIVYKVILNEQQSPFTFDLDLNSVKVQQNPE